MAREIGTAPAGARPRQVGFLAGATYPVRALSYILGHPRAWPFCVLPLLINIAVVAGVWVWTGHLAGEWMADHLVREGWWGTLLRWLAVAAVFLLRLLAVLLSFVIVGNMASSPFNDFLSEHVDKAVSGWRDPEPFGVARMVRTFVRTPVLEFRRLAVYGLIMVPLLLASFMPLLTLFAAAAQFLVSAHFFALDGYSYPLERRGVWTLREKYGRVRRHRAASLGFGLAMSVLFLVPVVNFLFIPLSVVGGTLLFLDLEDLSAGDAGKTRPAP